MKHLETWFLVNNLLIDIKKTAAMSFHFRKRGLQLLLFFLFIIWFVRLLALWPLLAYCASLG
jgi:hypothetical protein